MTNYTLSAAAVERIAKQIVPECSYSNAVKALSEENCHRPERRVEELIRTLSDLGYPEIACALGASAAYESARSRELIRQFRRAFRVFLDPDYLDAGDRNESSHFSFTK
jgi:hypothetical protein